MMGGYRERGYSVAQTAGTEAVLMRPVVQGPGAARAAGECLKGPEFHI
jgi:hypothetical protein